MLQLENKYVKVFCMKKGNRQTQISCLVDQNKRGSINCYQKALKGTEKHQSHHNLLQKIITSNYQIYIQSRVAD